MTEEMIRTAMQSAGAGLAIVLTLLLSGVLAHKRELEIRDRRIAQLENREANLLNMALSGTQLAERGLSVTEQAVSRLDLGRTDRGRP